jgi:hypothetical protein
MKKLLGITSKKFQLMKKPSFKLQISLSGPTAVPPMPAEFKISAFAASQKNEFKEQEKIKKEQLERLIKSKKAAVFHGVGQKALLFKGIQFHN